MRREKLRLDKLITTFHPGLSISFGLSSSTDGPTAYEERDNAHAGDDEYSHNDEVEVGPDNEISKLLPHIIML